MTDLSGHTDDGAVNVWWALPTWSDTQLKFCSVGFHLLTRKRVVWGLINYFTPVERWYCACGRKCWVKIDRQWGGADTAEPGSHLDWIKRHVEVQKMTAKYLGVPA